MIFSYTQLFCEKTAIPICLTVTDYSCSIVPLPCWRRVQTGTCLVMCDELLLCPLFFKQTPLCFSNRLCTGLCWSLHACVLALFSNISLCLLTNNNVYCRKNDCIKAQYAKSSRWPTHIWAPPHRQRMRDVCGLTSARQRVCKPRSQRLHFKWQTRLALQSRNLRLQTKIVGAFNSIRHSGCSRNRSKYETYTD